MPVIGMFGGGTVGGGVVELLAKKKGLLGDVTMKKICVRSIRARDYELPEGCSFVTAYADILEDPEIDTVIEVMGGVTDAKDIVFAAIAADKHVITANKALLAAFMPELEALLAAHPTVRFMFEAAVCGAIPVISTLQQCFRPDNVTQISGIMNGTTNYMLTKMEKEGVAYDAVLQEAQELGYAEADPTADVGGFDVQSKLAVLVRLAFGLTVAPADIPTVGIQAVTSDDFEYASKALFKSTIKLLGVARRVSGPDGAEQLCAFVSPVVVPDDHVIASVGGATNVVDVASDNCFASSLVGPGAGRFPTANSVVSDLARLADGLAPVSPFPPVASGITFNADYEAQFYVRLNIKDAHGIIKIVGQLCEDAGIGIYSILQNTIKDRDNLNFVVTTDACKLSQIKAMASAFQEQPFCLSSPVFMPFLGAPASA